MCTVQTEDLILPRIGCIPQLHSCIEKKFMPEWLCCIVRNFTLAPQVTHDPHSFPSIIETLFCSNQGRFCHARAFYSLLAPNLCYPRLASDAFTQNFWYPFQCLYPNVITINVPLFKKLRDKIFFLVGQSLYEPFQGTF